MSAQPPCLLRACLRIFTTYPNRSTTPTFRDFRDRLNPHTVMSPIHEPENDAELSLCDMFTVSISHSQLVALMRAFCAIVNVVFTSNKNFSALIGRNQAKLKER